MHVFQEHHTHYDTKYTVGLRVHHMRERGRIESFSGLHTLKKDYRESFSGLLNPPSLSHGAPASLLYIYITMQAENRDGIQIQPRGS